MTNVSTMVGNGRGVAACAGQCFSGGGVAIFAINVTGESSCQACLLIWLQCQWAEMRNVP